MNIYWRFKTTHWLFLLLLALFNNNRVINIIPNVYTLLILVNCRILRLRYCSSHFLHHHDEKIPTMTLNATLTSTTFHVNTLWNSTRTLILTQFVQQHIFNSRSQLTCPSISLHSNWSLVKFQRESHQRYDPGRSLTLTATASNGVRAIAK